MKKLAILGLIALSGVAAHADELFNNGPVVNANGRSILIRPSTTYGFADGTASGYSVADDFTVTGTGWNVTDLDFFNYQTSAGAFTFTDVTWSILSGSDPSSATVVASGTTAVTNAGLVGYRVTLGTRTNTDRAIYDLNADISDVTLAAGDYWLVWNVNGTGASGPWQPPTSDRRAGNALQYDSSTGTYSALVDTGSGKQLDAPFIINGTVAAVPEPATWASLAAGLGLLGLMRSRRRAD